MKRRTFLLSTSSAIVAASSPLLSQAATDYWQAKARNWSGDAPLAYPDPDIIKIAPRFKKYVPFNTPIKRHFTGGLWHEGPAWNGVGRYLIWSDIPNNYQLRWLEDDGRVTRFRKPSNNSNGNTFDHQGRQVSCEHLTRRVVRYEYDGSVTIIADQYQGKPLNSPNDVVVANDGSIWFTDPPFGIGGIYEGEKANPEQPNAVYRVDAKSGAISRATDEIEKPNGLCFSPDQSKLYVTDTGSDADIKVWDVEGSKLKNGSQLTQLNFLNSKKPSKADGIRCDVEGNIWAGARPGVQVVSSNGELLGAIRLPEVCANICFGGAKRNRLFMTASQSLYSLYLNVRGAGIA